MKKRKLKILRKIAAQLPPVMLDETIRVSGKDILSSNPQAKDKEGNPVTSDKIYNVKVQRPHGHYKTLKRLQKEGGVDAVNEHIKAINEMTANAISGQSDIIKGLNERANHFSI